MTREILFKAIDEETGNWIEGWLRGKEVDSMGPTITTNCGSYNVPVKDGTVCQFTGGLDSNKDRIFEGDRVIIHEIERWEQKTFPESVDCYGFSVTSKEYVVIFRNCQFLFVGAEKNEIYFDMMPPLYEPFVEECTCGVELFSTDECNCEKTHVDGDTSLVGTLTLTGRNVHDGGQNED